MLSSKSLQTGLALLLSAVVLLYFGSPYWALNSLQSALKDGDVDRIQEAVDFPSVREGLRAQFTTKMAAEAGYANATNNPMAALGMMIAPAIVNRVLDSLVTPEGLAQLLKEGRVREQASTAAWPDFRSSSEYVSLNTFRSTLTRPDQTSRIVLAFRREGFFGWRLTRVEPSLDEQSADGTQTVMTPVATPDDERLNQNPSTVTSKLPTLTARWLVGTWAGARNNPTNDPKASCDTDVIIRFSADGTYADGDSEGRYVTDGRVISYLNRRSVPDMDSENPETFESKSLPSNSYSATVVDRNTFREEGEQWRRCTSS